MPFVYTELGQRVTVVLAALREMGGDHTKLETIAYIEKMGWLELHPSDWEPYHNHQYEAKWHTDVAFARQYCVNNGLMQKHAEIDAWQISPRGSERLSKVREKFRNGVYLVADCTLWSASFKTWLKPDYDPTKDEMQDFC